MYIAVEINDSVKQICHAANPKTLDFPGVDHSWHSDIFNITERDIAKLDSLEILTGAPECKDMSKLRLLPAGPGYKNKRIPGVDPRPGLDGPSGKTFRHMLQIVKWAVKHHPSVQYFIECVEFSDLHASWAEVKYRQCCSLGALWEADFDLKQSTFGHLLVMRPVPAALAPWGVLCRCPPCTM